MSEEEILFNALKDSDKTKVLYNCVKIIESKDKEIERLRARTHEIQIEDSMRMRFLQSEKDHYKYLLTEFLKWLKPLQEYYDNLYDAYYEQVLSKNRRGFGFKDSLYTRLKRDVIWKIIRLFYKVDSGPKHEASEK